ncbi:MAG: type VI secretion system baseplate subunit TssF [Chitinispirillales bacterium]|jgi:type VI secretion system protein ImpG|nr:type VI secretion system baseplate subunit TssF [Chitinispirillales bacterium]
MVDDVYFEEELRYLREESERFARMYPQRAQYLSLDSAKGGNPRFERLFEAFAFLSAGIRRRLDDEFPELTEGLTDTLWPQLLEPVPGTCIVEFASRTKTLQTCHTVGKGTNIFTAPNSDSDIGCRLLTTRDVIVNPFTLDKVECATSASGKDMLTLAFKMNQGTSLESLRVAPLRLYIHADLPLALRIRKLLLHDVYGITLRDDLGKTVQLYPSETFVEGGFGEDDNLFPEHRNVYRPLSLIKDYFTFPERFLFVDIFGLDSLPLGGESPSTLFLDVRFDKKIPGGTVLTKSNFRLYCVPAVNVFRRNAEPLYVDGERNEYEIIPDAAWPKCYTIHSVESVTGIDSATGERRIYGKFCKPGAPRAYSLRRERQPNGDSRVKLSMKGKQTEKGQVIKETLHIETWQTNGTLARKAVIGGKLCSSASSFPEFLTFENITNPNNPIHPPNSNEYLWKFISHLASMYSDFDDAEKLKDFLYAYDWAGMSQQSGMRGGADAKGKRPEIEAIMSVKFRAVDLAIGRSVVRGVEMNVAMNENIVTEEALFLLGTVLARALSGMASINTLLRLLFTMPVSGKTFEWCCQAGEKRE